MRLFPALASLVFLVPAGFLTKVHSGYALGALAGWIWMRALARKSHG